MKAKEKALQLVKISFTKISNAADYREIKEGDEKLFYPLFLVSKDIAIEFIEQIIQENHKFDNYEVELTKKLSERIDYWNEVKREIILL